MCAMIIYYNFIFAEMVRPVDGFKENNYNGKFVHFQECLVLNDARSCSVVQGFSFFTSKIHNLLFAVCEVVATQSSRTISENVCVCLCVCV